MVLPAVIALTAHPLIALLSYILPWNTWVAWVLEFTNLDDLPEDFQINRTASEVVLGRYLLHEDGHGHADAVMDLKTQIILSSLFAVNIFIPVVLIIVFACIYKPRVTDRRPPFISNRHGPDFAHSLASFHEDGHSCIHAWCCIHTRVADTLHVSGVWSFWTTFLLFVVLFIWYQVLLIGSTALFLTPFIGQLIGGMNFGTVFGLKRGQIRKKFGGEPDCLRDFFVWWCLPCCATIQEAREIDETQGVKVRCCFKLKSADPNFDSKGLMDADCDSVSLSSSVGPPVQVTSTLIGNPATRNFETSSPSESSRPTLPPLFPISGGGTADDSDRNPPSPSSNRSLASSLTHPTTSRTVTSMTSSVPGILTKANMDVPPPPSRQPSSSSITNTIHVVEEAMHIWDPEEADADMIDIVEDIAADSGWAAPALRVPPSAAARNPGAPNTTSADDDDYTDYLDEGDLSVALTTFQEENKFLVSHI